MPTVYGHPAIEVVNPDGEVVLYVFRRVICGERERRAYLVVKANGSEYRCVDLGSDHWTCTCQDWRFRSRKNVETGGKCKHIRGLLEHLEPVPPRREE